MHLNSTTGEGISTMSVSSRFNNFLLVIVLSVTGLSAEVVNLSGTVRNTFDKPVIGAQVRLSGDTTLNATTDSSGTFSIYGQITAVRLQRILEHVPTVSLRGSNLRIISGKTAPLSVDIFSIAGRSVFQASTNLPNSGLTIVTLPMHRFSPGYYLVSVVTEGRRYMLGYVSPASGNNYPTGLIKTEKKATPGAGGPLLRIHVALLDTLVITADEYDSAIYPIDSYQQSGIAIVLEGGPPVSRLEFITRSCDGLMPSPISGGQSGWGSRYWDCCKPHCSSPQNTSRLTANCGTNGIDEIDCFKEVGNEYATWLESTKSGCESDGIAYACYRHVPFAVCENLAFGFAAVPGASGSDKCGTCFQLDFDGGAHNGDVKAAHQMMKGKTMIVMASNIGHDVSSGQFDLMIPGGGVGAFSEGCRKQWGVDVTDENIVGKNLGGFISKCQDRLGWDANVDSLKECVRGMCDNLFGNDPSRRDLWEGCIWYVDWMNAVDNPTFKYKEITCPTELIELYYSKMHPRP